MKFRKIPVKLQQKVLDYFEHRYQRKIFDERGILHHECMSNPLKKVMFNCIVILSSLHYFIIVNH